ncbi:MAG: hypothetical protein ACKVT2_18650 [Saprospiraceae bacterium]
MVMLIDQSFVNEYGGDVASARNGAFNIFDLMRDGLNTAIFNIGGYEVYIGLVYFPEVIAPDNWSTGGWSVSGFWNSSARKCINFDGRIMLTGQDIGIDGYQFGGPLCQPEDNKFGLAVSGQFGESRAAMTMAHEILHALNLGHINNLVTDPNGQSVYSTTCGAQCETNMAPLMCIAGADVYRLTACDLICLRTLFDDTRCDCFGMIFPLYSSDFICDDLPKVLLASNQTFLSKGCNDKRNTLNVMVVVNGSLLGISNATLRIRYNKSVYDWIPSLGDFDTEVSVDNFHNELVLKVNNEPNGAEELISLQQDEERIFHFSLTFNPAVVDGTINNGKTRVLGILSDGVTTVTGANQPQACEPVSGTVTNLPSGKPLLVEGDLVLTGVPQTEFFITNPLILVDNGASISFSSIMAKTLPFYNTTFEGCSTMWEGLKVNSGSSLELNGAIIKDAQYGVEMNGGSLAIMNSTFYDNNFGVKNLGNWNMSLKGNQFSTSVFGLKPSFLGQSPLPGTRGFAGIYISNYSLGLNIQKDPMSGLGHNFSNLHYGILAENTNVTVRDAIFTDIVKETRPVGYPGPLFTGSAIHLTKGSADVKGSFTGIAPGPVAMDNCHTGVNVLGGSIDVAGCEMGNMTNGIIAGGGVNKAYTIYWNNISAAERGISVYYQSGLPGLSSIDNNIVHMAGNANGVGIANGGQEMFPQQEGFVANNSVTIEEGATGIQIGVANQIKVTQNYVNLAGSNTLFGIKMEVGDRNVLNCNTILGTGGNNDGIFAIHASRASVLCNLTNGLARGLRFEGMLAGKNKADIGGNTMENNTAAGLLLGTDAVIGEQVNRGNRWNGTSALAGVTAPFTSKFTVDASENSNFLPFPLFPPTWFLDLATPSMSFDCGFSTTCPPPPGPTPDYPLDIKIVKGELGGTTYQAANQWLSQRRFYELVIEEGNPYPSDPDVSNFLSQAQTNGISGYANVQIGIRLLGAMNEGDRATAAANLLTLNAALTGNASYQVNEKLVNQIFLQSIAIGNLEFSETQISSLEGIATLCPLSDGEAVLRARAMYQLIQGAFADYDDLFICGGGGERSEKNNQTAQSVRIYPNPANDALSIDYHGIGNLGGKFLMFNAQGQSVREIILPSDEGVVQLITNGLPNGIYWYSVPGITEGKVLIQH